MTRPEPRYVVTELAGFRIETQRAANTSSGAVPGLSCQVVDRHWNYEIVATFRSEQQARWRGREGVRTAAREQAAALAARLNA